MLVIIYLAISSSLRKNKPSGIVYPTIMQLHVHDCIIMLYL